MVFDVYFSFHLRVSSMRKKYRLRQDSQLLQSRAINWSQDFQTQISASRLCAKNIGYAKTANCCSHELSIGRKISKHKTSTAAATASRAVQATSITNVPKAIRRRKRSNGWDR